MNIFRRETVGEITVITLDVQNIDANNSHYVTRRVADAMPEQGRIIVDLGALRHFDVGGFAAILSWAGGGQQSAEVRFCSESGTIWALFELLRARAVVSLYRSREEALTSFERPERRGAEVIAMREKELEEHVIPGQRIA